MNKIRNILLVGRTGQGKSSLANLLVNKNDNFEEVFKVGSGSISITKNSQIETFEEGDIIYRIIDTPSFSDTELTSGSIEDEKKIFYKLAQITSEIEGGINQILFVIDGRFTEEEVKILGLLIGAVFDQNMFEFTTIVRTNFPEFEYETKWKKDYQELINGEGIGSKTVEKTRKVIYIDNPPAQTSGSGKLAKARIAANKEIREESRKILLDHLATCQSAYEPKKLQEFNNEVGMLMRSPSFARLGEEEKKREKRTVSQKIIEQNFKTISEGVEKGIELGGKAFPIIGKPIGALGGLAYSTVASIIYATTETLEGIFGSNKDEELSNDPQSENSQLKTQVSNLNQQVQERDRRISKQDQTIQNNQQQINNSQNEIALLNTEITRLNKSIADLQNQLNTQTTLAQQNQTTINDLRGQNQTLQTQNQQLQQQNQTLQQTLGGTGPQQEETIAVIQQPPYNNKG